MPAIGPSAMPAISRSASATAPLELKPLATQQAAGPSFASMIEAMAQQTARLPQQADTAVLQSLQGGNISQVEVMSAVKKADLALRMMVQVRNKLLEAYNEVQQMRF